MKYVNEETEVRSERGNPFMPITPEATINVPPVEEMLTPFYSSQAFRFMQKHAAKYRRANTRAQLKLTVRNAAFIAFAFVMMGGDAVMNVLGIMASSNTNRERRVVEKTAVGKAKIEAEFTEMIKAEEARAARQDDVLKALRADRAKAETSAEKEGKPLSITRLKVYAVREDSIESKKTQAENGKRDHIGKRNDMIAKLEAESRANDSTGFEFWGLLCVGAIIPFAVGMAMYRAAQLQGQGRSYEVAGFMGQLLAAYFTACFVAHEVDGINFSAFGLTVNPPAIFMFGFVLYGYAKIYEGVSAMLKETPDVRQRTVYYHRNELVQDLRAQAEQIEVFMSIGDKLEEIKSRQLSARFDFKGEAMRLKAQAKQASTAAQNMAESQAAVAELHALIPKADSAADFGRRLYEMEVAGKLEYLVSRAGTLKAVCEIAGWGEQYGTVTKTMNVCREKAARASQEAVPPHESGEKIGE